jgi:hypothetical protein
LFLPQCERPLYVPQTLKLKVPEFCLHVVFLFHSLVIINSDGFPKRYLPIGFCNGDSLFPMT